jgi:hypothetical protein
VIEEDEPEERKTDPAIPPLYTAPFWSGKPNLKYTLELIQGGVSKGKIPLHEKSWYLFGRAPICDIILDNPVQNGEIVLILFMLLRVTIVYLSLRCSIPISLTIRASLDNTQSFSSARTVSID